jgi:DNA mismatch endonuclease, patch repair protein
MSDYPWPASALVSARMKRNPKFNTGVELRLRSELHRRGLRFRAHLAIPISGSKVRPDIVFTRQRLAVFVDGCFWHCCPEHGVMPRHNSEYWTEKIARNRRRDDKVNSELARLDWMVVRLWEHLPIAAAADMVAYAMSVPRETARLSSSGS